MFTHDTIQQIGELIGMPYTVFNERGIPDDVSDGDSMVSGHAKFVESNGKIPPLLIFTGLIPGHVWEDRPGLGHNETKSLYVINLKTLKPTKKSYIQIELPSELKISIRSELNMVN